MDTTPETGWFQCEGGSVYEMDLPLPEDIQQRVDKRAIVRVANADGEAWTEPVQGEALNLDTGTADDLAAMYSPPPTTASKPVWVRYAVDRHGMAPGDAESLTKPELVDRFGRK